jgi:hypothetical protein
MPPDQSTAVSGTFPTEQTTRPTTADVFTSIHLDYKLALNGLGLGVFVALIALTLRRGVKDAICGMTVPDWPIHSPWQSARARQPPSATDESRRASDVARMVARCLARCGPRQTNNPARPKPPWPTSNETRRLVR